MAALDAALEFSAGCGQRDLAQGAGTGLAALIDMQVEIKAAPGTNSGIFFRTPPMDKCDKYLNGSYEAQIQNDAKAKSKFLAIDGKLLKLNTQSSHSEK